MSLRNYVLFDGEERLSLLPFTYTRAIADIRIGILTIREKWNLYLQTTSTIWAHQYLQTKYGYSQQINTVFINASVLPDISLAEAIEELQPGRTLVSNEGKIIAIYPEQFCSTLNHLYLLGKSLEKKIWNKPLTDIRYPWNIFSVNGKEMVKDIEILKLEPNGHLLESDNRVKCPDRIYVSEGARVTWAMLNATDGPIYLGPHAEVMEGAILKGNLAICEHAQVKMGAKIYGDTTIGPYSRVGGEVSNSVILGYSNKGHDGFLGNSVLGEWCNLGADTNNSNLKNNYSTVKAWSYSAGKEVSTGLQFCGLMMGDHSKSGINTMFNTGTVVGVAANIFGGGFPPKFIPSFSWGGADGFVVYQYEKAIETAERVMQRRGKSLSDAERQILWQVFEDSETYRKTHLH
jgi:UDP-N-acetylglucosamine diphosphorylase/glucosamine-1-phosphate N-acetyltransferase